MDAEREHAPGARLTLVVVQGDDEVVIARMSGLRPDLDLIASLAGLRLAAGRLGIEVQVRQPCAVVHDLIVLVGLADALTGGRAGTG